MANPDIRRDRRGTLPDSKLKRGSVAVCQQKERHTKMGGDSLSLSLCVSHSCTHSLTHMSRQTNKRPDMNMTCSGDNVE